MGNAAARPPSPQGHETPKAVRGDRRPPWPSPLQRCGQHGHGQGGTGGNRGPRLAPRPGGAGAQAPAGALLACMVSHASATCLLLTWLWQGHAIALPVIFPSRCQHTPARAVRSGIDAPGNRRLCYTPNARQVRENEGTGSRHARPHAPKTSALVLARGGSQACRRCAAARSQRMALRARDARRVWAGLALCLCMVG